MVDVGTRSVVRIALAAGLALAGLCPWALPAGAAGAVFDDSGAVAVVGSTVVVSTGAVEQLDLRWKLARAADALAVAVPVSTAATASGAPSDAAQVAGKVTAPHRRSVLLHPWILLGDPGSGATAARDALDAPTQPVRVSENVVVSGADLPATLARVEPRMGAKAAKAAAASVVRHSPPGSHYAVALLHPQRGTRFDPGWVGTLRLTVRGGVQSTSTLPAPGTAPTRVSVPLPGGVLGARGPQVVAVTAESQMVAADGNNTAPLVTGVDRSSDGRWQTVLYGQGGGEAPAADVVEAAEDTGPFHAVEPVILADPNATPWLIAGAVFVALAAALLWRGVSRRRQQRISRAPGIVTGHSPVGPYPRS